MGDTYPSPTQSPLQNVSLVEQKCRSRQTTQSTRIRLKRKAWAIFSIDSLCYINNQYNVYFSKEAAIADLAKYTGSPGGNMVNWVGEVEMNISAVKK